MSENEGEVRPPEENEEFQSAVVLSYCIFISVSNPCYNYPRIFSRGKMSQFHCQNALPEPMLNDCVHVWCEFILVHYPDVVIGKLNYL